MTDTDTDTDTATPVAPTLGIWPTFAIGFVVYLAMALTWAAATPMFGVPDEISHMIRAAGAARGDLAGVTDDRGDVAYRAPQILYPRSTDGSQRQPCYAFDRQMSPSCLLLAPGDRETRLMSSASAYPPLYYVAVGWPSRVTTGLKSLYAMRAASAAWFAALLALATVSLRRSGRGWGAYGGLAVALTPMVWFLGGSVNPSAISSAAGIAAWCGGYVLVTGKGRIDRAAAMRFGLPLCALLLVRRDSILWAGIVVVALALMLRRDRVRELLQSRAVLAWAAASFASAFYAARVGASGGAGVLRATDVTGSASAAFGRLLVYLDEMIGVLGWLDTPLPRAAYLLWYLSLGLLLLRALGEARPRRAVPIVFVLAAVAVAIIVIGAQVIPYFQGRYGLPAAVGAPLLAGLAVGPGLGRRGMGTLVVATVAVELLAFYHHLRRYAIPGSEGLWLFGDTAWRPPTAPIAVLLGLNVVALAVLMWSWAKVAAAD